MGQWGGGRSNRRRRRRKKTSLREAIDDDDGRLCRRAAGWRAVGRRLRPLFGPYLSGKARRCVFTLVGAADCLEEE